MSGLVVLALDSNYEPATAAGFRYREANVYPYLMERGLSVVKCQGTLARRYIVEPETRKEGVFFLTGVGHGSNDEFTGDQGDTLFRVGKYSPEEVSTKIVHFLSCKTATALGPDFVASGCVAYFGYDDYFSFVSGKADIFF